MTTVGLVSPGYMGSGIGWALRQGGARVVATVAERSARTRRLADEAGLELVPTLSDVVADADVVLSITPPGRSLAAAGAIAAALKATSSRAIVADLNAVSPTTMTAVAHELSPAPVVDGAISGAPPNVRPGARIFLSGEHAAAIADLPWSGQVQPIIVGAEVGAASATKMCTASVYKGLGALLTQAIRTAGHHGVLDAVVADLSRNDVADLAGVVSSATKAHRFVDEMHEIATTQSAAGLTPDLFTAIAAVYQDVSTTTLAEGDPETTDFALPAAEIVDRLNHRRPAPPSA
ncbi:DUF1932 domain-containing protein [Actinoplanes sp. NPDC051470]|uniref:NAD(P)-dependent oxidoreductase n=1 Tax=unclassified Actinoplanes TaxID=2626549 RepID=UPI0034449361